MEHLLSQSVIWTLSTITGRGGRDGARMYGTFKYHCNNLRRCAEMVAWSSARHRSQIIPSVSQIIPKARSLAGCG